MGNRFLILFLIFYLSVSQFYTRNSFRRNLNLGRLHDLLWLHRPDITGGCVLALLQSMGGGFLLLFLIFHLSVGQFHTGDSFRWNRRSRYRFHDLLWLHRPDITGRCLLALLQSMGGGFLSLFLIFHLSVSQFYTRNSFRRNLNLGRLHDLLWLHRPDITGCCLLALL